MKASAIDIVRRVLTEKGYPEVARMTAGDDERVWPPFVTLTPDEAVAFMAARRVAYLAIGLAPCRREIDCGEEHARGCFIDGEDEWARQLRSLTTGRRP